LGDEISEKEMGGACTKLVRDVKRMEDFSHKNEGKKLLGRLGYGNLI
jgi:hypothetical protein